MFGFFNRAAAREHSKLVYQNSQAAAFLSAFDPQLSEAAQRQVDSISLIWAPGQIMRPEIAHAVLQTNRALRRAYDKTPAKHAKKFDVAFQPIGGWKDYYNQLLGT